MCKKYIFAQNIPLMKRFFFNPMACVLLLLLLISCGKGQEGDTGRGLVEVERIATPVCNVPLLDETRFSSRVFVKFTHAGVELSALPAGVVLENGGRDILLRSNVPGVEYVVSGTAHDASLAIASDCSPLVTLDGLSLTAHGRNTLQISSKELIHLRSNGASIADVTGEEKPDNQSAAVKLMGRALLSGGSLAVGARRRCALFCTDTLYVAGMQLSLSAGSNSALLSNRSIVIAGGAVSAAAVKDVVKCKRGDFIMLGGSLAVGSQQSKADGIQAQNIYIVGGDLAVNVGGAAADGIKAKGNLAISGGNVSVAATGGALFNSKKSDYSSASCVKCNAVVDIRGGNCSFSATGDGSKGISCDSVLIVSGGMVRVSTEGGDVNHSLDVNAHASSKGIKSDGAVYLLGGNIEVAVCGEGERSEGIEAKRNMYIGGDTELYVYAYDDALNAAGLAIAGGHSFLYSVVNDAVDSNGTLAMSGGTVVADGSCAPEQGVDVDDFSLFEISGGTLVSVGGSMGPSPALPLGGGTSLPVVTWGGINARAGEYLSLSTVGGELLCAYRLARGLDHGAMLVASGELGDGGEYRFALSGGVDGAIYCGNGLYTGGRAVETGDSVVFEVKGIVNCVADDGKVKVVAPGSGMPFGNMPPPPPPPHMSGGAMPGGAFPPPPPSARRVENVYGCSNLPNYDLD